MDLSNADFEKLKESVKKEYDAIGETHCPYFNETVKFSSDGFRHLLYKGSFQLKPRPRSEQCMRLRLFKLVLNLIRITKTVQEYHMDKQFVEIKQNKRREIVLKEVKYWGFIAIIDGRKIKVIVKQIGEGQKRFWSVIPNWSTRKSRELQQKIHTEHSGDLEND